MLEVDERHSEAWTIARSSSAGVGTWCPSAPTTVAGASGVAASRCAVVGSHAARLSLALIKPIDTTLSKLDATFSADFACIRGRQYLLVIKMLLSSMVLLYSARRSWFKYSAASS